MRIIHLNPDSIAKAHKGGNELACLDFLDHADFGDARITNAAILNLFALAAFELIRDSARAYDRPRAEVTGLGGMSDKLSHCSLIIMVRPLVKPMSKPI